MTNVVCRETADSNHLLTLMFICLFSFFLHHKNVIFLFILRVALYEGCKTSANNGARNRIRMINKYIDRNRRLSATSPQFCRSPSYK
ncbi:hypothetical protein FKM82_018882 [Ascaphus truei]